MKAGRIAKRTREPARLPGGVAPRHFFPGEAWNQRHLKNTVAFGHRRTEINSQSVNGPGVIENENKKPVTWALLKYLVLPIAATVGLGSLALVALGGLAAVLGSLALQLIGDVISALKTLPITILKNLLRSLLSLVHLKK